MMTPEKLPEATEKVLAGLSADENLKHRIVVAATSGTPERRRGGRLVPVLLCSLVTLMIIAVFLLGGKKPLSRPSDLETITTFTAGDASVAEESAGEQEP